MPGTPDITYCPVAPYKPFAPCDGAELVPLLHRLSLNEPVDETTAFPRGTLLADGRLDLCKQQIGPAGAAAVASALRSNAHVKAILLGADGIGDEGAAAVAGLLAANSAVSTVYLGCNGIGPAGVAALAAAIDRGSPVTGLWLKRNPIGDDGAFLLARLLERNNTLRTLDLVNTQIGLRELCNALAGQNRTVRRVYLGGNGIGPAGAAELAGVLRRNNSIQALLLNANRLGDAGVALLADALRENRSLRRLGLAANGIGPAGAAALAAAVRGHPSLVKLDLGYCASAPAVGAAENRIGDAGAASIANMLRENRVLAELDVQQNGLTAAGVTALAEALEQGNAALRRLTVAIAMPQALQIRLRRIFARNRGRSAAAIEVDTDVLAIRSVYRV
jgi:Ran GTPase-activating protein (RanGAP) involved in mRNA processing and transport